MNDHEFRALVRQLREAQEAFSKLVRKGSKGWVDKVKARRLTDNVHGLQHQVDTALKEEQEEPK